MRRYGAPTLSTRTPVRLSQELGFTFFMRVKRPQEEDKMIRTKLTVLAAAAVIATGGAWISGTGTSHAAEPFLCPAVGHGVLNAPNLGAFEIAAGYSFFPADGNNQAGAHANEKAINPEGPGTSPGPGGGNSDWSPIWPG